jgi:hypothetical protein
LDIFTGPVGSASTYTPFKQIHDYAPTIPPSGLFWTAPLHPDSLQFEFNSASASLHVDALPVPDAHDLANSLTHGQGLPGPPGMNIPPIAPVHATVSFDVQWSGEIDRATVVNEAQNFRGDFIKTGSTIRWSSIQDGFSFESEDPDPARSFGATIGREQNGVFFNEP